MHGLPGNVARPVARQPCHVRRCFRSMAEALSAGIASCTTSPLSSPVAAPQLIASRLQQSSTHIMRSGSPDPLGIESRCALTLLRAAQCASGASVAIARQVGDDVPDCLKRAGVIGLPSRAPIAPIRRPCAFECCIQARCAEGFANLLHWPVILWQRWRARNPFFARPYP